MPREVFVDTGGWYASLVRTETAHASAARALEAAVLDGRRLVTTNLVVAEAHALLLVRVGRPEALRFLRQVRQPPTIVVRSDEQLEARAVVDWVERYRDQDFTLTDAVSFTVMADRGIGVALALDRHFAAAGFRMIPASGVREPAARPTYPSSPVHAPAGTAAALLDAERGDR